MYWTGWAHVGSASAAPRFDLGIDTASDDASLVLVSGDPAGGEVVASRRWDGAGRVARDLFAQLQMLLEDAEVTRERIARIAVCIGPGQYGSLRAGIAAAQGLALALDVPLAGVPRFDADAEPYLARVAEAGRVVVAVHHAGRGSVGWAVFAPDGAAIEPSRADAPETVLALAPRPALWVGELEAFDGIASGRDGARDTAPRSGDTSASGMPRAESVVRIARRRALWGDPATVDAIYLRPPSITPPRR